MKCAIIPGTAMRLLTLLVLTSVLGVEAQIITEWSRQYAQPPNSFSVLANTTDLAGNTYFLGYDYAPSGVAVALVKYSKDGFVQWNKKLAYDDVEYGMNPTSSSIIIDNLGGIYLTGKKGSSSAHYAIKLSSNGDLIYETLLGPGAMIPMKAMVLHENNLYVTLLMDQTILTDTGWISTMHQSVFQIDHNGTIVRQFQYSGFYGNGYHSLLVNDAGDIFIGAYEYYLNQSSYKTYLRKFNASNDLEWTYMYNNGFYDF